MAAGAIAAGRRAPGGAIAAYLAVAFGGAWLLWGLAWRTTHGQAAGLPLMALIILGSFAPFPGAAVATAMEGGVMGAVRFFARGFNPKMGWGVFALAFCLTPALCILAVAIDAARTHGHFAFQITWADLPVTYLFLFFLGGAVNEEFGWSYLSDKLDELVPMLPGTLVLGIVWAVWHLPLFYIVAPGLTQYYTPFGAFLLGAVAMRALFSWAYHRSGRNILSNIVFHNSLNLGYSIVAVAPSPTHPDTTALWILVGLAALCAAAIWHFKPVRRGAEVSDAA